MNSLVVASAGAVLLGPFTLAVAHHTMHRSWRPTWSETAAVVVASGLTALLSAGPSSTSLAVLPLVLLGPAAAVVDAREGRLPDLLTVPLAVTTLLLTTVTEAAALQTVVQAAIVTSGGVVIALLARDALGWGDVKLLPTLALVLSGRDVLANAGLLLTLILLGVTTALVRIQDRRDLVPYGPALVIGTLGAAGI